jgi:hypothetical protein
MCCGFNYGLIRVVFHLITPRKFRAIITGNYYSHPLVLILLVKGKNMKKTLLIASLLALALAACSKKEEVVVAPAAPAAEAPAAAPAAEAPAAAPAAPAAEPEKK